MGQLGKKPVLCWRCMCYWRGRSCLNSDLKSLALHWSAVLVIPLWNDQNGFPKLFTLFLYIIDMLFLQDNLHFCYNGVAFLYLLDLSCPYSIRLYNDHVVQPSVQSGSGQWFVLDEGTSYLWLLRHSGQGHICLLLHQFKYASLPCLFF